MPTIYAKLEWILKRGEPTLVLTRQSTRLPITITRIEDMDQVRYMLEESNCRHQVCYDLHTAKAEGERWARERDEFTPYDQRPS